MSGGIAAIILLRFDIFFLETIIAGGLGGLLLAVFLGNLKMIGKMTLAGLVAVPVGFWGAFALAGVVDLLFSFLGANTENPSFAGIGNIIGIIFMGMICVAIFGAMTYGRKSVRLFSIVCGLSSFPFGILVGLFNSEHPIKATIENIFAFLGPVDLNLLAIIASFGVGIGLSIGLYNISTITREAS